MASKQDPVSGVSLLTNEGGRIQPYSPGPSHATQTPGHSHCLSILGSLFYTRSPESLQLQPNHFPFLGLSLPEKEMVSPQRSFEICTHLGNSIPEISFVSEQSWEMALECLSVCLSSLPRRPNAPLLRAFSGAMESLSPSYLRGRTQAPPH